MAGKPKIKMYQYDTKGAYIRSYDSISEVFDKYYDGKKGDLLYGKDYRELPDGTYISDFRIGKVELIHQVRIDNDPLCNERIDYKSLSAYNRKGDKVASFKSIHHAHVITGWSMNIINSKVHKRRAKVRNTSAYNGVTLRFDNEK